MLKNYQLIPLYDEGKTQKRYANLLQDVADHFECVVGSRHTADDLKEICDFVLSQPLEAFKKER